MSFAVLPGGDPFTTPPRANQTLVGRPLLDTPSRKAARDVRAEIQRERRMFEARRKINRVEIAALKAQGEAQQARLEQIRTRARDRRRRYNLPEGVEMSKFIIVLVAQATSFSRPVHVLMSSWKEAAVRHHRMDSCFGRVRAPTPDEVGAERRWCHKTALSDIRSS